MKITYLEKSYRGENVRKNERATSLDLGITYDKHDSNKPLNVLKIYSRNEEAAGSGRDLYGKRRVSVRLTGGTTDLELKLE